MRGFGTNQCTISSFLGEKMFNTSVTTVDCFQVMLYWSEFQDEFVQPVMNLSGAAYDK